MAVVDILNLLCLPHIRHPGASLFPIRPGPFGQMNNDLDQTFNYSDVLVAAIEHEVNRE
jgi:hypothetical protein